MRSSRTRTMLVVGAMATAITLTGCSGSNEGGDTTCGDYLSLDSSGRSEVVEKFLSDEGRSDGAISVNLTKASVLAYCNTVGNSSDPIRNIDG